jgi:hypothetical protein
LYLPALHARHTELFAWAAPEMLYRPAGQEMHALPFDCPASKEYLPALHSRHVVAFVWPAPAVLYLPAGQAVQFLAGCIAALYRPAAHATHAVDPGAGVCLPGPHARHVLLLVWPVPATLYLPIAQAMHVPPREGP